MTATIRDHKLRTSFVIHFVWHQRKQNVRGLGSSHKLRSLLNLWTLLDSASERQLFSANSQNIYLHDIYEVQCVQIVVSYLYIICRLNFRYIIYISYYLRCDSHIILVKRICFPIRGVRRGMRTRETSLCVAEMWVVVIL